MNPNQALWEKGDFTRIAASMRASGEALVDQLGITKGLAVLDLGCGDGTTAVPAARRGAMVLGVDIARNLVEAGNKRAADEGLDNLRFQQGDACELTDLADDRFDHFVVSGRRDGSQAQAAGVKGDARAVESGALEGHLPGRGRHDEADARCVAVGHGMAIYVGFRGC